MAGRNSRIKANPPSERYCRGRKNERRKKSSSPKGSVVTKRASAESKLREADDPDGCSADLDPDLKIESQALGCGACTCALRTAPVRNRGVASSPRSGSDRDT